MCSLSKGTIMAIIISSLFQQIMFSLGITQSVKKRKEKGRFRVLTEGEKMRMFLVLIPLLRLGDMHRKALHLLTYVRQVH